MTSSRTITLFEPPSPSRTGPSSFLVSVLSHVAVLGLIFLAIAHTPRIAGPSLSQRYSVRILRLQRTEPRIRYSRGGGGAQAAAAKTLAHSTRSGGRPAAPAAPQQLAQKISPRQTLVQPDVPPNLPLLPDLPIPTIVMWRPEKTLTPKIMPPPPQKTVAANVLPSPVRPNLESHVSNVELSSTAFISETLPVPASTTSPIAIRVPGLATVPESASKANGLPTPATMVSVSDVVAANETVTLPLADQSASAAASDSLAPGRPDSTADAGSGMAKGNQTGSGLAGNGSGKDSGDQGGGSGSGKNSGDQGNGESAANGKGGNGSGDIGSTYGSNTGSITGDPFALDRITLPRNGQYGVVVVGASLAEEYPETIGMWAGRLAYTVYLHVGLTKNWILQYSLPRVVKASGNGTRPDAPWPYIMVRPHIMPEDSDSDAIMVHGFINSGGHFEQLAVVFPPRFSQTKFVLGSLQQWEFRPAIQNGRQTPVEVLLIIPEEAE